MSVFEVEKIYTSAKADEVCIKDLCDTKDERVFDYAINSAMKLKKVKAKISKKLITLINNHKIRYSNSHDPKCFDAFYNDVENEYKGFFNVVMQDLKKMYLKA